MGLLALRVAFRAERTPQSTIDDIVLLLDVGIFFFSPNYAWYALVRRAVPLTRRRRAGLGLYARRRSALPAARAAGERPGLEDARYGSVPDRNRRNLCHGAAICVFGIVASTAEFLRCASVMPATIVSVVIPCLNEEEPIAGVVAELLAAGRRRGHRRRQRLDAMRPQRARGTRARASFREPQRGYGRACAAGVAAVRADAEIVCFLDGDGSDVPAFLRRHRRPRRAGRGRLRDGLAPARQARARQHDAAADCGGAVAGALMRLVWGVRSPTCRRSARCVSKTCAASA